MEYGVNSVVFGSECEADDTEQKSTVLFLGRTCSRIYSRFLNDTFFGGVYKWRQCVVNGSEQEDEEMMVLVMNLLLRTRSEHSGSAEL